MAQQREVPDVRARNVGEILDASINIWTSKFKTLTPLTFWVLLPFQVLSVGSLYAVRPSLLDSFQTWSESLRAIQPGEDIVWPTFTRAQIGAFVASQVLSFIAAFAVTAALTSFISEYVLKRGAVDTRAALRVALRRGPALMLSSLLSLLIAMIPLLVSGGLLLVTKSLWLALLIVLASIVSIWLSIRLNPGSPAVVVESVGPIKAIKRGFFLSKGRWWPIAGLLTLSVLIVGIPARIITAALGTALKALGGNNDAFEFIWTAIAQTVASALTQPIAAAISVFLYFDLRARREGFDMQRLAQDLGATSPTPPPASAPSELL